MIELGHFLPGGAAVTHDKGVNETYRGIIEIGGTRLDAYVKLLPDRQLVNELLASVLGRLAGINLPRAFLVRVEKADYPKSLFMQAAPGDVVAFATVAVGQCSILRRINVTSRLAVAQFLKHWNEWPEAASFDEWIANGDRHPGNLLIGLAGEVWLIDHSHAFTGPSWLAVNLDPTVLTPNQLCVIACATISLSEKFSAKASALGATTRFEKVDAASAASLAHLTSRLTRSDLSALTAFVAKRAPSVYLRIGKRLGLPSLSLGVGP